MKARAAGVGVLGALLCASALADGGAAAQPRDEGAVTRPRDENPVTRPRDEDDARFFCVFTGDQKGDPICRAFGQFDAAKPQDNNVHRGDSDDFLKIVCGNDDNDSDQGQVVFDGSIAVQLAPDADDHGNVVDTRFLGPGIDVVHSIHVQDLDWDDLNGGREADLTFGVVTGPLTHLTGHCEFRREDDAH